jgi:chromosome segregation ATPase
LSIPNIGNLSLADLNNNDHVFLKDEKENKIFLQENYEQTNEFDEIIMNYLKEDEQECFDQILAEFHSQFNELELKEDSLRHEILIKNDEISKLNNEIDELRLSKNLLLQEIHTKNNKVNDFKSMIHSVNFDEITVKEFKKDEVNLNLPMNFDELSGRSNKINKLIEENNFYKEIILKLKEDSFKLETEISQMSVEIENYEKFKNFLLIKNKELENNLKDIKCVIDTLQLKSDKLEYELEEI